MTTDILSDISVKPRVLIADDSRIVRATLIKHIEGMFEFREALDGEQAWETLLLDPNIRVVITDLTMPKLDGYGLLKRIRASKIGRIHNIPVVVVSGSDEQEERDRAKAAGATDLITKGIGTAQLLSRLDILSKLVTSQSEFERSLEALVNIAPDDPAFELPPLDVLERRAEIMLENAKRQGKNFVILNACISLKSQNMPHHTAPPLSVINAIGQLLQRTVRQTDCVAKTGLAEFTLATGNIHFDSARNFAQRVCGAVANANLIKGSDVSIVASCGMASLSEYGSNAGADAVERGLNELRAIARRRALLGMDHVVSGVVGPEEEKAFLNDSDLTESDATLNAQPAQVHAAPPDIVTMLRWMREGKQDEVLKHRGELSAELRPLVDLMIQREKH
jgi:two-component system cell cycle response regulator